MDKNKIIIYLSASGPSNQLELLIQDLKNHHFNHMVVITEAFASNKDFFNEISEREKVKVLSREAEVSAFEVSFEGIQEEYPSADAAIIVDTAGHYSARDIEIVAKALVTAPDDLILGVRQYASDNIPSKTKWGNRLIQRILNSLEKRTIEETPTSLRAFSIETMKVIFEKMSEFSKSDLTMLEAARTLDIQVKEVPVYTNYIETEEKSYVNRLVELMNVYHVFFKFTASSLISTAVDLGLFTIFIYVLRSSFPGAYIMYATIIARVVSTLMNYTLNNKLVFKRRNKKRGAFIRYIALAIFDMLASGVIVTIIVNTFFPYETFTKILVDTALFFVGFLIQRKFVFTGE